DAKTPPETLPAIQFDADAWSDYIAHTAPSHILGTGLKFHQSFGWTNFDNEPIPDGTRFVAAMPMLKVGWQKWWDGAPAGHELGMQADGYRIPPRDSLGDNDESKWQLDSQGEPKNPWQEAALLPLLNPKTGDVFTYSTGSWGGRAAIGGLMKEYALHA